MNDKPTLADTQSLKPDIGNPGDEIEIDIQVSAQNIYPFALGVHQIAADVYSLPGQKRMFQCTNRETVDLEPGEAQDLILRFTARPTEAVAGLGTLTRIALKGSQPVNQKVTVSTDDLGLPGLLDIFKHN